MTVMPERQIHA